MDRFIKVVTNDNQERYYQPQTQQKFEEVYASLRADKVAGKIKSIKVVPLKEGASCAQVIYWTGNLAIDCKKAPKKVISGERAPKGKKEEAGLAAHGAREKYYKMYEDGLGFLTQEAVGDGAFKYIFTPCK